MKTTSKIAVAAILIGFCSQGSLAIAAGSIQLIETDLAVTWLQTITYEQAIQILSAAHQQYWYDHITMADLIQRYNDGVCTIEKESEGYRVNGGGGLGGVLIQDYI
jgi:hypothetical protein